MSLVTFIIRIETNLVIYLAGYILEGVRGHEHCANLMLKTSTLLTSTVSTCTISTSTNFIAIGIKLVLVELLCSKISTSGNWLCSTH